MDATLALKAARKILRVRGLDDTATYDNFLDFAGLVSDVARDLTPKEKSQLGFDLKEWAENFRRMYDNFDKLVQSDPMMLYRPANQAAFEFHSSPAYIRYFRAGNRTSKTQSGYAEHYLIATGQHKWRKFSQPPSSTFIVAGLPFTTYAPGVFERKFLTGEDANPLSPMFPVGGKWFYHYDERQHTITLACPTCAQEGKAGTCPHPKSTIKLFSNENGWEVLQGAAYLMGHFDEHVDESFFAEARQRTKTVPGGCLIVTGTPLHGYEAWEHRLLTRVWEAGSPENRMDPDDVQSPPLVSLHQVDQYTAGLVPHSVIKMEQALMDEFEIDSRIYGRPAPLAKNPVFDRKILQQLRANARNPLRGALSLEVEKPFIAVTPDDKIVFRTDLEGEVRVWEKPDPDGVYICSVDTAAGLQDRTKDKTGDASCATVLKLGQSGLGITLEMVAQYHGWRTPYEYADLLFLLGTYYNSALMVIELTGGLGIAVMQRLRNDHVYWNLYREASDATHVEMRLDGRLGIDTNASTKPFMIASLKQFIKEGRIKIPCTATISELTAFEQENTGRGGVALSSPRFRGAGGAHDDRVMSLAIGTSTALTYTPLIAQFQGQLMRKVDKKMAGPDMLSVYSMLKEEKDVGI